MGGGGGGRKVVVGEKRSRDMVPNEEEDPYGGSTDEEMETDVGGDQCTAYVHTYIHCLLQIDTAEPLNNNCGPGIYRELSFLWRLKMYKCT